MYIYEVIANGTHLGQYDADDAQGALDACARDAGYSDEEDMVHRLGQPSELEARRVE